MTMEQTSLNAMTEFLGEIAGEVKKMNAKLDNIYNRLDHLEPATQQINNISKVLLALKNDLCK